MDPSILRANDERRTLASGKRFLHQCLAGKDNATLAGSTDGTPTFFRRIYNALKIRSLERRLSIFSVRMSNNKPSPEIPFKVGDFHVDPSRLHVSGVDGQTRLEKKAMQVLVYLAEHAGRVVSRPELEEKLWPERIVTEDAVTSAISKLRRAFGDSARHPQIIETIPKSGYRLIARVTPFEGVASKESTPRTAAIDTENKHRTQQQRWAMGIVLLLLLLVGVWVSFRPGVTPPDEVAQLNGKPAIAILPLNNLGAGDEQDYFANGITADLITDLSKVSGLLVIAPGSVFSYQDSEAGPRQISAELGVDYVVIGNIQHQGERLRVNVQLIEADVEQALWGERYEGVIGDIFSIQDELTAAVVAALEIELDPAERVLLAKRPTASIAAYDHYLRGVETHGHRSKDQNQTARVHFQKAIDLDPNFARAHAGLALTHSRDAIDGWSTNPQRSLEQAAAIADKAAEMDPWVPQVHFVRGQVGLFRGRHEQAFEASTLR